MEEHAVETQAPDDTRTLGVIHLDLPYVPEFLLDEVLFWFVPSRENPTAVFHELTGSAASNWSSYYTKKGWSFVHTQPREGEGPFRAEPGKWHLRVLDPGRIFAPRPVLRLAEDGPAINILSLEKRRPLNPWKPNYIQALNFIKKYEWPHPLPRSVQAAIWEVEECGQVAGSTSWKNAESILRDLDSKELRLTLADIFFNRPEDFPLGSEVYLRVLGRSGSNGFQELIELAKHPISRKRKVVANTLGELRNPQAVKTLLELLDDEDPDVRTSALRAIGKVGIRPGDDPAGAVAAFLDSPEAPRRVWAAQAMVRGGDTSHEKLLISLVKEEPRLLTDMGELGDVLADLGLVEGVPYLINRLKHAKSEYRADAAEALMKITGLDYEYQSLDTEGQRRHAVKVYTAWWEGKKKERKKP